MRTLVVGAMGVETRPLLSRLGATRRIAPHTRVGRLGDEELAVLTCGVGPHKAHTRTMAALAIFPADRVVSIGTAGALVDTLPRGAVRAATALFSGGEPKADLRPLGGLEGAAVATVARAVFDPERRALLAAAGAELVEMELAAVYDAARSVVPHATVHGVKVVSDAAGAGGPVPRRGPARVVAMARFQARAHTLCRQQLLPALLGVLGSSG